MLFKDYYFAIPTDDRDAFAASLGVSRGYLNLVAGGFRQAGESLCIAIDRSTKGKVSCEEMRPDVDWAYLRGTAKKRKAA